MGSWKWFVSSASSIISCGVGAYSIVCFAVPLCLLQNIPYRRAAGLSKETRRGFLEQEEAFLTMALSFQTRLLLNHRLALSMPVDLVKITNSFL